MYRLQDKDYKNLYPYFLPRQVKQEFGDRALSERSISTIYKKNFKTPASQKMASMIKETYTIADIESNEVDWNNTVAEAINNTRNRKKQELWTKIDLIEELTD